MDTENREVNLASCRGRQPCPNKNATVKVLGDLRNCLHSYYLFFFFSQTLVAGYISFYLLQLGYQAILSYTILYTYSCVLAQPIQYIYPRNLMSITYYTVTQAASMDSPQGME